jgi:hypothetical protein
MDSMARPIEPAQDRRMVVILGGLATTALALLAVWALDHFTDDVHVMGWYANYVLPVGALLVGLVASSGYGVASWATGEKITKSLLWTVLLLQIGAYFVGQYIEFRGLGLHYKDGTPVGFLTYFDFAARAFAWKKDDGTSGEPLGIWGYAFRLLEIAGFCAGSLIAPLAMKALPYCDSCRTYMKSRDAGLLPASVKAEKIRKMDGAAQSDYHASQEEAFQRGTTLLATAGDKASRRDVDGFRALFAEHAPQKKEIEKLPTRIAVSVVGCPKCHNGYLLGTLRTGQGKQLKTRKLGRSALSPDFVRAVNG